LANPQRFANTAMQTEAFAIEGGDIEIDKPRR
jgi:hypothetical protein